jgi:AraC-like DNA-binding protein
VLSDLIAHGHGVRIAALPRGRLGFHAMPIGAGYEKRQNELYSWEGLKRQGQFLLMQHTLSGRGELDYEGVHQPLEPGTTLVLSAPHRHRYWLDRGRAWEYFWIGVNGSEALRIGRAVIEMGGPVRRLPPAAIDRLADACRSIMATESPEVGAASAAAYAAVSTLYDGLAARAAEPDMDHPVPVRRALALIADDLSAPLGIDRLARAAGLSRAHFVRLFARSVGEAPSTYVFRLRLERAARLLAATDAPVAAIARDTGFASGNYFAKAFLRARGVTPSAYRSGGGR